MIDEELSAFLQEGLGIHIGTRNARFEPNGARAIAVRVEEDRVHIEVYLAEVASRRVMPDLEANGQAAVCVGRPIDERACQVKGVFVGARAVGDAERAFVMRQWEGFGDNLEQIGIPRAGMDHWTTWPAVAIRLKTTALFNQTPGPAAGTAIAGRDEARPDAEKPRDAAKPGDSETRW